MHLVKKYLLFQLLMLSVVLVNAQDKLYWLSSNSAYNIVRYDVGTNSIEQTRTNILGAGIPSAIAFNSSGSLHWYNDNFGSEHFYSITSAFGGATGATQESSTATILNTPRYLAYDATNDRIFATEINFGTQTTFIRSFDPDGANASSNLQSFATTFTSFGGIALDVPNNEMYWADPNSNSILKASMTTAGGATTTIVSGFSNLRDITLDLDNRLIYWIENNGFGSYIIRSAGIDGNVATNNASAAILYNISGSFDATELELGDAGDIFWSTTDFTTGRIFQGSTAASNVTTQPTPIFTGGSLFAPRLAFETGVSADVTAPRVASITRQTPAVSPTDADALIFRITFDESVQNVNAADFTVSGTTATVIGVAGSGTTYDITIAGGNLANLNGTVTLNFSGSQNISDLAGNALTNTTPTGTNNNTFVIQNIPEVTLTVNNNGPSETGSVTLTATASIAPSSNLTVNLSYGGTATNTSDYTQVGAITISSGATTGTGVINIATDNIVELNETIIVDIASFSGVTATEGTPNQQTITINDDDQATVTIADVAVNENSGTATITVIADNAVDGGFDVDVSTANGTATTADGDYTAVTSQTLTFAGTANESETFNITLGSDTKVEADETLSISMSGLSPVTVASGDIDITDGATLTLNNDDQATVTIANVSGNEDDGAITVTVIVDNAVDGGFDVDVSTADGTATTADSDYGAVTAQTLTFAGTASESETFTVTPTADATSEPDETVIIGMSGLSPATVASGDIDITDGATLTILNDDNISISVNDPSVTEGDAGTATLQFTVSLNAPAPAGGATVDYATSNGTAAAGSDYIGISTTTLSFLAGQSSQTVDITILGDETVEVDETLTLTLTNPTGTSVLIGDATGTGTITDDDQATVTIADVAVNENSGTATITVVADNAVDGGFDVDVSTSNGTATTADGDYIAVSAQTLTFAGTANESETFTVTLGSDTKVEADETVSISMSGLSPTTVASGDIDITDGATLTINNDDQATVTIADVSGNEDDGAVTVTVIVDNAVDGGFDVDVSTADGTATTADSDYGAVTAQTLTFSGTAGESETFTVTPTADATSEPDETVVIGMSGLSPATVASGDIDITDGATLTILNDDNISVSVNDPSVTEGDAGTATLQFTVSLNAPAPAGGATVDYATSDGTAAAGSDYTAIGTTTLSFLAGVSSQTVDITVAGDQTVEQDETLTLNLSNPTGTSVLIGDATGIGTITNDDQATVTIADVAMNENSGTATITVIADNAVDGGFDVDVSTSNGTATTADGDYTAVTSQTLTFAGTANESETFTITLGGDTKVEADETVSISMSNLVSPTVASGDIDITDGATLTINNDDQATVTIADVSGNEDDGAVTVTVIVDNAVDGGFDVDVSTADGTATTADSDYGAVTAQTLTFAGTAGESETFTVTPTADATSEPDETVVIGMSGLSPATVASGDIDITDGATLTILNDDNISVSVNDPTVTEGDAGTATLQFTVSLNAPAPAGGATVDFATSNGTAVAGSDYTAIGTTTLSFLAGVSSQTVDITVSGDQTVEQDETLTLTLSNPTGTSVLIGDATGTGTITNDDQATVTIADVAVNENSGTATITVVADNAVDGGFDVDVSTADGTATTADGDYTAVTSQTLTFAGTANESETFTITLGGDTKVEADETVSISMSNLVPSTVASGDIDITDGATLTINNDDQATLSIVATTQAQEGTVDGLFTITTTNQFSSAVTVNITVGGTATQGTDYATIGTSVVFPANQNTVTIPVDVTDDMIIEGNETVVITMTGTNNADATIGATDDATITIIDDDAAVLSIVATIQAAEDANNGVFTISTTNQFTSATNVTFTVGGTATSGIDFTALGTGFTFPANTNSVSIVVPVIADNLVEADETVIVTLTGTDNADVSIGTTDEATVTISDNDVASLSIVATTQAAEDATNGLFTVSATNQFSSAVTVNISVTGTATDGTDYTSLGTNFIFPANSSSTTIPLSVLSDNIVEADETVIVTMTATNNPDVTIGATDDATITITDNDMATLSIAATTQAAEDATDGLFTITTTNQFTSAVTVNITVAGSATEGTDYTTIGTNVVFPANQNTVTIPVDIIADNIIESDETVIITLTNTDNADVTVGTSGSASITITDDDAAVLSIVATIQAAEDANNGVFTISTTNQFTSATNVTFTVGGTATSGTDFTALGTGFTFPANTNSVSIVVPVIADDLDEMDETVILTLTGTDNTDVTIGATDNATITITDDDETPVVISAQTFAIDEDAPNTTSIGTVVATDTDAGTTFGSWAITSGNTDGIFDIDPVSGELTIIDNTNLDREANASFTLAVTVSDGINTSSPEDVTINIGDVNDELPVVTSAQSFSVTEGIANATPVGIVVATDADITATTFQSWTIVGGNTSTDGDADEPFAIDPGSGEISINDTDDINSSILTFSLAVTVSDGVNTSATEIVVITVDAINDAPSFTAGPDQTALEDAGVQTIANWASDISAGPADESAQTLTFNVSNDNTGLFDQQPSVSADGTLTFTPADDEFGSATITISLSDDGGTSNGGIDQSADQTFTIAITSVNDQPTFVPGDDQNVTAGAMDYTIDDWATDISSGPDNESGQTVAFNVSNDNNALFTTQPSINSDGDLTFGIGDGASGTAIVSVSLTDDGGTANGGDDTSEEITFTIMVGKLAQEIRFEPIPDKRVGEDPFGLSASGGGSGNPIIFTIETDPGTRVAVLNGSMVILGGRAGTVAITATQEGNETFEAAVPVTQLFNVLPNAAFLPNLFTPNNDGRNDRFIIRGGGNIATVKFSIIDRNSNVVFESEDLDELTIDGWDGTSGGKKQPIGTYVWQVSGTLDDGSPFLINGTSRGIVRLAR